MCIPHDRGRRWRKAAFPRSHPKSDNTFSSLTSALGVAPGNSISLQTPETTNPLEVDLPSLTDQQRRDGSVAPPRMLSCKLVHPLDQPLRVVHGNSLIALGRAVLANRRPEAQSGIAITAVGLRAPLRCSALNARFHAPRRTRLVERVDFRAGCRRACPRRPSQKPSATGPLGCQTQSPLSEASVFDRVDGQSTGRHHADEAATSSLMLKICSTP